MHQSHWNTGMQDMFLPQDFLYHPGERFIRIGITVRYKIMAVPDSLILQSKESNGSQILYIYKSNTLGRKADSKIKTRLYTFNLHEVIFLARSIHPCRTQDHIREIRLVTQIILRFQLALSIICIGQLRIIQRDRAECFLVSTPVAAQAAHQKKFLRLATRCGKCLDQVGRILGIDTIKVSFIKRLRQSGIMDHIIPRTMLTDKISQLGGQRLTVGIFQVDKTNPFILQINAATCRTDTCPGFISPVKRLLHQETTNKATGPRNQYLFHNCQFFLM